LVYKKSEELSNLYNVARVYIKTKSKTDVVPAQTQWKNTGLSGKQLKRAEVSSNSQTGDIQVALKFDETGTKLFADLTTRNIGKPIAIFLDGSPISVPKVNVAITSGEAVIEGGFTLSEAKLLAQRLNSGALPVPVELVSQEKVDATLGVDSLNKSLYAGLIGFLLVMIFMIIYYRFPGVLAVVALGVYAGLSLMILKLIGATMTLSGIAGLVLSIGMAVDANVLVFERMKEELRSGKTLRNAMEEAFLRAWPSIRDSNITTLISCAFLVWFGGGFVQGFAVTLAIGVLVSMFTAVTVTRTIMRFTVTWFSEYGNWMFLGHKKQVESNDTK
jgi:preprotein translocase subunit SecD